MIFSVVEVKNSEVLISTETTISCVVKGLTKQLDKVTWEKPSSEGVITDGIDGYKIDEGSYQTDSKSQTTILTIPATINTFDAVYTCVIQSDEHGKSADSPHKEEVQSNIFSEL